MGSKKHRGQLCAYCAVAPAASDDHVIARTFFPIARRNDLPQVGACHNCNGSKSALEHYLATVLPFGGRHEDALSALQDEVPRRLAKNLKLQRELADGIETIGAATPGGRTTTAVPIDGERLLDYLKLVTRGLMCHHWGVRLTSEFDVIALLPITEVTGFFDLQFSQPAAQKAQVDLGKGAFVYTGAQGTDYPQLSIWRYSLYGGAAFREHSNEAVQQASVFYAITGKKDFIAHTDAVFSQREDSRRS